MVDLPVDLRTIVTLKSWEDAKFAEDLRKDPKKAVTSLAKSLGLDIGTVDFNIVEEKKGAYTLVIAENPMGAAPAQMRAANKGVEMIRAGGGTVNSYTADCGCGSTYTGGCSCGSVFGTPCLACATALLC